MANTQIIPRMIARPTLAMDDSDSDSDSDVPLAPRSLSLKRKCCDAKQVQVGDFVSRTTYAKVVGTYGNGFALESESGKRITASNSGLENWAFTAGQHTSTRRVTVNELVCVFRNDVRDKVFSFSFTKPPTEANQDRILAHAKLNTAKSRKRVAAMLVAGTTCSVPGAYVTEFTETGRVHVRDMEANMTHVVDIHTVKWLCCGNVRYEVKK